MRNFLKKLFTKIIAIALALTVIFSFTACDEVENGSKIQRIKITLQLDDGVPKRKMSLRQKYTLRRRVIIAAIVGCIAIVGTIVALIL